MHCSVYAECSDNLGILEWDSLSNTLVQFFPNQTGYLSAAPADDKILVLDYDTPTVNVLQPNGALCSAFRAHLTPDRAAALGKSPPKACARP